MNQTDIIKYFDEYIKNYSPYTNDKNFTSFIDYLSSKYTYNLYENIPYQFKKLFEQNKIPNELYDILLENIGIPKKILSELFQIDKINFFNNFSNFYRFRGNIEFFNKISKLSSNNTFDVYELYIDYFNNDWIFKPNKIINNMDSEFNYLNYDDVYNAVPNFLINKTQLNSYKNNNNLILPLKSNLILLNYSFLYKSTGLTNLIFSTFLKEYQDKIIIIYFKNEKFNITLKMFVLIWFYLFLKLYNNTSFVQISNVFKCLLYSDTFNPYNIMDLETIISKYNNISNSHESYLFYNQYLENYFLKPITFNEYNENNLKNFIPSDIINYLNLRISSYSGIITNIYNDIFAELLYSFNVYLNSTTDEYFLQYSDIFLNSLFKLIISPEKTGSFKFLNHYKPYHVDFITNYSTKIVYDSKFDIILPVSNYNLKINYNNIDNYNIIDYINNNIKYENNNILNITDFISSFNYNKLINIELGIDDEALISTFNSNNIDNYNIIDYININNIKYKKNNVLNITDFISSFNYNKLINTELGIDDEALISTFNSNNIDNYNIIDYINNNIKYENNNVLNILSVTDFSIVNYNKLINIELGIDDEALISTFNSNNIDNYNIIDYININNIKYKKNNVLNITDFISSFNYNKLINTELGIDDEALISTFNSNNNIDNYNIIDYINNNIKYENNNVLNVTDFVNIKHLLPNVQYIIHPNQQIELYCNYSHYEIYYTLDGSIPTTDTDSILYISFINYTDSIKAIAYSDLDNSYSNILTISL